MLLHLLVKYLFQNNLKWTDKAKKNTERKQKGGAVRRLLTKMFHSNYLVVIQELIISCWCYCSNVAVTTYWYYSYLVGTG